MKVSAWIPILMNLAFAVLGVLQAADWVHLVGGQNAGIITATLAGINAMAHAIAGKGPAVPNHA